MFMFFTSNHFQTSGFFTWLILFSVFGSNIYVPLDHRFLSRVLPDYHTHQSDILYFTAYVCVRTADLSYLSYLFFLTTKTLSQSPPGHRPLLFSPVFCLKVC